LTMSQSATRTFAGAGEQLPAVFQMAVGYWMSQAVYVAAKLGIADLLADSAKSCGEIARQTGADSGSLFRLMRALVTLGILASEHPQGTEAQRFSLTESGALLQSGMPGSMRSMVLTLGEEHFQAWGKLLHSIQTGQPAFNAIHGRSLFEYFGLNPAAADVFNAAMSDFTRQAALAAMAAYDFSGISSVADIGGGQGAFIRCLLRSNQRISGVLFDSLSVIEGAKLFIEADGLERRCRAIAGDFFESVPHGSELYVLKNVLHDWDDKSALTILKNCRRAIDDSGRLLVIENVMPDSNEVSFGSLLDLNMLVMCGGQERTGAEFRRLLEASGFQVARVVATMAPVSIIEATPAPS
jgi:hypothetical protein